MSEHRVPSNADSAAIAAEYEPTLLEREALESLADSRKAAPQIPHLKVTTKAGGVKRISPEHPDVAVASAVLMRAVGTKEFDFLDGLLAQIANVAANGHDVDELALNFMCTVIAGIQPRDQLESLLAAQMAAVHLATMTFARRLNNVENIRQQDSAERAFNKLARTFAAQMEALKRYRSTGEQRMTVEHQHVTVNEGGQAIVGNVTTGGGGASKKCEEQPHAKQLTDAPGEALPRNVEAVKEVLLRPSS